MNTSLAGRTIFITGGNDGIGLATACLFSRHGANVAITGRRADRNEVAREQIASLGGRCLAFAGDVSREDDVRTALESTVREFGGLHYAFNNAGVDQSPTPLLRQSMDDYQYIMDINLKGVWLCIRHEIPYMLESGGGAVVNTASVGGQVGMPQMSLYCAAKHAVIGLTKSIALEYARQNIRVNAVCPGVVHTAIYERLVGNSPRRRTAMENMQPVGRSGRPEEVASAVLYLCRDATWTTGQAITMDGGYTAR